jgi:hypothetical protein
VIDTPEYRRAREIAAWFLGYPCDEDDARMIEGATPLEVMNSLEWEVRRLQAIVKELRK